MAEINIARGSDEINTEMSCEDCYKHGNKTQTASAFCVNCVKYFCATCFEYHQRFLPDHVHQDKDSMPFDIYLEKCHQHPEELVKFYCLSCKDTACSRCKTTFHKTCTEIHHLPKLAMEFDKEKEFSDLDNSLDLLEKGVANIELTIDKDKQRTEQYKVEAKSALRKQKEEVDKIFDNFEQDIEKIHTANKNLLDLEKNSKDLLKTDIKNLKTETERLKKSSKKCQTFLKIKKIKDERKQIQEKLMGVKPHLEKEICQYRYKLASQRFKPDDFGRVVVQPRVVNINKIPWCTVLLVLALSGIVSIPILTRNTHISVEKLSDIEVEQVSDISDKEVEKISDISDIKVEKLSDIEVNFKLKKLCYLSEHSLLILDTSNEVVHVYNPKDSKWTGKIHRAQLTDITRVSADIVAATFTGNVELWSISSSQSDFTWELTQRINVGEYCRFTQYRRGKLFLMCPVSGQNVIKIFDDNGNKLKSFIIGFKAQGMTVSPDGQTIYISTYQDNSLISYNANGEVIGQYKNESLKDPSIMTTDSMGNLLVCSYYSQIFYLSADLTYGYELLNESHGIIGYPHRITYNERESILYVSSRASKSIQVFKINVQ